MNAGLIPALIADLDKVLETLEPYRNDCGGGNLAYGYTVVKYLRDKLLCRDKLVKAYAAGDRAMLRQLAETDIPALAELFEVVMRLFRKQWLDTAKVFGLETMQHRMGGQLARIKEASLRINEYLAGVYDCLEELEAPLPDTVERMMIYCDMASGSVMV
jgi:hypothetical protein